MPLKIRMKRRLMVSDQTSSDHAIAGIQSTDEHKQENQKLPLPQHLRSTDNSSCNIPSNNNSNIPAVRVCADCNTTKTPLWRGGPRGPKTLCNACGIRQRKARRALAAASTAAANGAPLMAAADQKPHVKRNHKLQIKGKKSKTELKKKPNLGGGGTKKLGSEELTISLSKSLALPQDEEDAAILLMALSHGLLHGFPSHRYLDL
uniref:GATA-type domain-containing protein n=1 Tax=Lotus japonicus TaxID=34305 RepID=I3S8Q9_LOTJA|nr:unknown [Lotus japonicus]